MPYFSIKVFQVVITSITTLGFYSTLPDIKLWLKSQSLFLPFKDDFLTLDRQTLELFVFAVFLMTILVKLYVVITVWYCYRHMMFVESYRNQTALSLRTISNGCLGRNSLSNVDENNNGFKIDDESLVFNGIGSPPKYDDIIKQIKDEKKISAKSSMPITFRNVEGEDDQSSRIVKTSEEQSVSNSLLVQNKTVEPPSYDFVTTSENLTV